MKIKELANRVLNGCEAPKKIIYKNNVFVFDEKETYLMSSYKNENNKNCSFLLDFKESLEEEIEVIWK